MSALSKIARFLGLSKPAKVEPAIKQPEPEKKISFSAADSQPRTTYEWRAQWLPWGFNDRILHEGIPVTTKMAIPDDYPQRIEQMVTKNAMLRRIVSDLATFLSAEPLEVKSRNQEAEKYINNLFDGQTRYNIALDAVMYYGISAYMDLEINTESRTISRKVEYIPFKQTRRNNTIVRDAEGNIVKTQFDFEPPICIYRAYDFRLFSSDGRVVRTNILQEDYMYGFYQNYWGTDFAMFYGQVADPYFQETVRPRELNIWVPGIPTAEQMVLSEGKTNNVGCYWHYFGQDPYYPVSPIESVMNWAQVANDVSDYFTYLIHNQMTSGLMVFLPSQPTATDQDNQREADKFKRNFSGKRRAGDPIIGFYLPGMGDIKDKIPMIVEMKRGTDVDNQYLDSEQRATERIINALGFYRNIAGLDSASGFSDKAEEIDKEFQMLEYLTLNIPKQILIRFFNQVLQEKYPLEEIALVTKLPFAVVKTTDQDAGANTVEIAPQVGEEVIQ